MTRLSSYLLPTEKEAPADAEAVSHRLMVRAGLIRQVGAGLWTWLPAGWRAHQKAVAIIREEQDRIGAQEMLAPLLQPAETWRLTGRYEIDELFKLHDRKGSEMVLAMTHEEAVTTHVAQLVRSYRELPLLLYQFQVKERDEPRPRAGVLRTREFVMKDAYSFDRDEAGLERSYARQSEAYERIFDRTGLRWYRVAADVGMMGGSGAHEYMAPCQAGENEVALAPGYAANVEVASAQARPVELPAPRERPQEVATPGLKSVADVAGSLGVAPGALLKAFPVVCERRGLVLVLVRGDHRVNEVKLANALRENWRPAREDELSFGPAGYLGPVGAEVPVILDDGVQDGSYVTGANRSGAHLIGVEPGRDFSFERADVRSVEAGDLTPSGHPIEIEAAIEIANIFKLGTRYSEPLGARFLDQGGRQQAIVMGSYGIGPARIVAAAAEQFADERGIAWPRALSPWEVHLVALGKPGTPERELAEEMYSALQGAGVDLVFDDRDGAAPGEKFADADLLGCPLRLTVGKRSLEQREIEALLRRGMEARPAIPADDMLDAVRGLCRDAR